MIEIDKIMERMRAEGRFLSVHVHRNMALSSSEDALSLLEAIGENSVKGFVIDGFNERAYKAAAGWISGREFKADSPGLENRTAVRGDHAKGFYVAGRPGSGKSLFMSVLSMACSVSGLQYSHAGRSFPLGLVSVRAETICHDYARNGDLEFYIKTPVLCVHDIGSESKETLYMGNRCEVIRQLIEARGDASGQFTFVTSNFRYDRIKERYGDRAHSRLFSMFNYLELSGTDRRIK